MLKHEVMSKSAVEHTHDAAAHSSNPETHAMEHWISYVLRYGVVTSAIIIVLGGVIFLIAGPAPRDPHSLHQLLNGQYSNRSSLHDITRGLRNKRGLAVVDVGLMLLILTPVVRVGMTFVMFFLQKDWKFVALTAVVLSILVLGLSGAGI